MNELQIFENSEFGTIRTILIDNEPWLVGKDVAEILGYSNPQKALRDHIDEEDKTVNESFTVNGTMIILINESGLYSLILSSKLPTAKKFKHWVTSEVLPTIRKKGSYAIQKNLEISQDSLKQIIKETICQVAPEIFKQLEAQDKREKEAEEEMKRISIQVRNRIEYLLYSENYTFSEISKILEMEGHNILPSTICNYARYIGIY